MATGIAVNKYLETTEGASTMAGEASLIVSTKATLRDVAEALHSHPTLTEGFGFLAKNMLLETENSSRE